MVIVGAVTQFIIIISAATKFAKEKKGIIKMMRIRVIWTYYEWTTFSVTNNSLF